MSASGVIDRYREHLPVNDRTPVVSLREGSTPLLECPRLAEAIGVPQTRLFLKLEGMNPTGSFKDRGMTMAVSKAVEEGAKAIVCASTGNTSAAAAAYAARAGLKCVVFVPEGNIALGKLSQALMYGAQVLSIEGNFDEALELVKEISASQPITMVNSLNEMRIHGQKTGAFEIIEALGRAPDYQFMPVGNAGNITAYWLGYTEYFQKKKISTLPRMMGFQAAGAAPIVLGSRVKDPKDRRHGDQDRKPGLLEARGSCPGRIEGRHPVRLGRGDSRYLQADGPPRRRVLRTGERGGRRGHPENGRQQEI